MAGHFGLLETLVHSFGFYNPVLNTKMWMAVNSSLITLLVSILLEKQMQRERKNE